MSYEEIKNIIEQDLISNGFENTDKGLTRIDVRHQQIVINGQAAIQELRQEIRFVCLGEGYIENNPTVGYAMYVDDFNVTDLWCTSLDDFKYLLKTL